MRRRLIILAILVVIFLAGVYFYGGSQAPAGQPALVSLNSANLEGIKDQFNAANHDVRVLLLLSPT